MLSRSLNEEVAAIAQSHGLDHVAFCSADVFHDVRRSLHERKAAGLSADMQFTYRNPDRATDPGLAVEGAQSIIVGARSYRRRAAAPPASDVGTSAIAEYVWETHYAELRFGLDAIAEHLRTKGCRARVLVDDNALVDRAAAHRAGLGWWGKNSNILIPNVGSKVVLGSVVTDALLDWSTGPVADQCGPCRRCIDACPTDAIVADGVIDANRCLAWLVQSAGVFPRAFRSKLGDRIYGCDDCQTTCPPNVLNDRRNEPAKTAAPTTADLDDLLSLDDDELIERFGAWYIPKREPRYLRRNALVVLGNVADATSPRVRELVETYIERDDEIERTHAVWAAHVLGYHDLVASVSDDTSELVQDELAAIGRAP